MEEQPKDIIDLRKIFKTLWSRRSLFYKTLCCAFVISSALILPVPRYYVSSVLLAPEAAGEGASSAIGSIASSFGIDLNAMKGSEDAIQPLLYPDLFESNEFIVSLLDIPVTNEDGDIHTSYYDYLANHQKSTFYMVPFKWLKRQIKKIFKKKAIKGGGVDGKIDPFRLSERETGIVEGVKANIRCNVDKQFYTISIQVTDQDRLICATLADSVRVRLQNFITEYRTNKARVDLDYYERLTEESKKEYEFAIKQYSDYCDANRNSILQSYLSKRDDLENKMQMQFQTFTAMNAQLQNARAKVQEKTPAFTILNGASVPIKPAGPKRMLFVLGMLILTAFSTALYILKDDIASAFQ